LKYPLKPSKIGKIEQITIVCMGYQEINIASSFDA